MALGKKNFRIRRKKQLLMADTFENMLIFNFCKMGLPRKSDKTSLRLLKECTQQTRGHCPMQPVQTYKIRQISNNQ